MFNGPKHRRPRRKNFFKKGRPLVKNHETGLYQVECNIDDQSPEQLPPILEKLLKAGAKDAWLEPIIMKKGRPAVSLKFLAAAPLLEDLLLLAGRESSTAGLRFFPIERLVFPRKMVTVVSPWGPVAAKAIYVEGSPRLSPEFESAKDLAEKTGVPLRDIMAFVAASPFCEE